MSRTTGSPRSLPVLATETVHVSALKAVAMLGLGRQRVRALSVGALERELADLDGEPAIVVPPRAT